MKNKVILLFLCIVLFSCNEIVDKFADVGSNENVKYTLELRADSTSDTIKTIPIDGDSFIVPDCPFSSPKPLEIFSEWNSSFDGTLRPYNVGDTVSLANVSIGATVIFYATWIPDPDPTHYTYNIFYMDQGMRDFSGNHEFDYPTEIRKDKNTILDTPTKPGYNFAGYYWNNDCSGEPVTYVKPDTVHDVCFYAKWEIYKIKYFDQGGAPFSGIHEAVYPTTLSEDSNVGLDNPSSLDRTFEGYYREIDCSGLRVYSLPPSIDETGDVCLYAKWNPQ